MSLWASILSLIVGILLIVWTLHIVLTVLGWILAIGGAVWLLKNLFADRTDL